MDELEDEYGRLQCELTKIRIAKEKIHLKTAICTLKINELVIEYNTIELEKLKAGKQHE